MPPDRGTSSRPISISPPPKRRRTTNGPHQQDSENSRDYRNDPQSVHDSLEDHVHKKTTQSCEIPSVPMSRKFSSPVQLNFVEQLPGSSNVDTVSLGSILGNVMIQECWLFNYLFDLDFVM